MTDEEWRPVLGWEGLYEVSDLGRVRSLDRTGLNSRGRAINYKGRLVGNDRHGYRQVFLRGEGRTARWKDAHVMVAEAFLERGPEDKVVRHLDGDPSNNHIGNLAWGTHRDNALDMIEHGRHAKINQTHCKWGHEFTTENTYTTREGHRQCRTCRARRRQEAWEKYGR